MLPHYFRPRKGEMTEQELADPQHTDKYGVIDRRGLGVPVMELAMLVLAKLSTPHHGLP